ncbi:hypothetical protein [Georgenia subflava]|uniref:Hpt domain-containing protein n=1 Tax=Georgenia subflava TaxID=1622177 RepID=A0A6N7EKM9_9MICO|nr:hypothetical protein [Georgenia subflava]MPV37981.1 hypothetical protein [Georgenia subflava]
MSAILDPTPLRCLCDDVGPYAAKDFAGRWLDTLEPRVTRLRQAVLEGDVDESYAAALSLQTSSLMVGAELLARHAQVFARAALQGLGWPALRALAELTTTARMTTSELTDAMAATARRG